MCIPFIAFIHTGLRNVETWSVLFIEGAGAGVLFQGGHASAGDVVAGGNGGEDDDGMADEGMEDGRN